MLTRMGFKPMYATSSLFLNSWRQQIEYEEFTYFLAKAFFLDENQIKKSCELHDTVNNHEYYHRKIPFL